MKKKLCLQLYSGSAHGFTSKSTVTSLIVFQTLTIHMYISSFLYIPSAWGNVFSSTIYSLALNIAISDQYNTLHVAYTVTACKESRVRYPEDSGFCNRASDFCS